MSQLPQGWSEVSLSKVAKLHRGVSYKKNESSDLNKEGYLPVLRANNIQNGKLILDDLVYVSEDKIKENQFILTGDIVVAMSSGSKKLVGKSGIAKHEYNAAFGAFCGLLRPVSSVDARYIGHFTRSKYYQDTISELSKGVNINNLKPKHFDEINIPLAPAAEQKRIADKLDSVLAKVEAAQARLDNIPTILKHFRQSVLAAATSGELTRDWRVDKTFNVIEELKKIDDCRQASFEIDAKKHFEKTGKKLRKYDFSDLNDEKPIRSIPDSWEVVSLGNLIAFLTDYHANGSYEVLKKHVVLKEKEDYACMIRATNFEKNNFSDLMIYVDKEAYEFLSKSKLYGGEILVGKIGNAGFVYYMPHLSRPCSLAMNLFALRFNENHICSKYVYYFLKSFEGEKNIRKYVRGVATKSIDKKSLRSVFVNLPSHEEQLEIVRKVEELFAQASIVEKQYNAAKNRLDKLTQSILAKAFRGELVKANNVEIENEIGQIKVEVA